MVSPREGLCGPPFEAQQWAAAAARPDGDENGRFIIVLQLKETHSEISSRTEKIRVDSSLRFGNDGWR